MSTYYGGEAFKANFRRGLYGVGRSRYGIGYCPSCQNLTDTEIQERFDVLRGNPGDQVRQIWLWAVYGEGGAGSVDPGWAPFWAPLAAWLDG